MTREVFVLAVLVVANLLFALPAFDVGLLADNDFVGHWAYATWLAERAWPDGMGISGWSPRFNLGAPFLLYNPPPLLYVVTALTARVTGVTVLTALKVWVVAAFASVPPMVYAVARSAEEEPSDWPLYAALAATLFSSELYGLEFFLANGMVNAACGLPLLLAVIATFNQSRREHGSAAVRAVLRGAALFLVVLLTHLMSAYMACLCMLAIVVVSPMQRWGAGFARMAGIVALGGALSAAWLVPSLAVAGHDPVVFTWIRGPQGIIDEFFSGRLFSSYSAVFYPRLHSVSYTGGVAFLAGAVGAATAWRRGERAILGMTAAALLCLWVALGPRASLFVGMLPLYDELLWYRFVTPAIACWLVVAGYGLWALCTPGPDTWRASLIAAGLAAAWTLWWFRFAPLGWPVAAALVAWAALLATRRPSLLVTSHRAALAAFVVAFAGPTLLEKAGHISTDADFPRDRFETGRIAEWLTTEGDPHGRIYSEFLSHVPDAISVNHPRHVLPTVTGLDEVAGWIYENNDASRDLHRRGLFWYTPFPILGDFAAYDVKYVVARSEPFRAALDADPRWEERVQGKAYGLYEAVGYTPSRVQTPAGTTVRNYVEQPLSGGAWRISFDVDGIRGSADLIVKTNHSEWWTGTANGVRVGLYPTDRGLLGVRVPPTTGSAHVELVWSLERQRTLGRWVTVLGGIVLVALLWLAEGMMPAWLAELAPAWGAAGALVAALWSLVASFDRDYEALVFGLRDGMLPGRSPQSVEVGGWDDTTNAGLTRIFPDAWSDPELVSGRPARVPDPDAPIHALLVISPVGESELTITATGAHPGRPPVLSVRVVDPRTGEDLRVVTARAGEPIPLHGPTFAPHDAKASEPGVTVGLHLDAAEPIAVTGLDVAGPIVFLEAEGLRNDCWDGGRDFWIHPGGEGMAAHDGALITTSVVHDASPVGARATLDLEPRAYELWVRLGAVPDTWGASRADVVFFTDGLYVGDASGAGLTDVPGLRLAWERVGVFQGRPGMWLDLLIGSDNLDAEAWADLDLLAAVPTDTMEPDRR